MKIKKIEDIRGFAALYVVIHHFIGFTVIKSHLPAIVRLPFRFGQEAVIIFFLISGFVIYMSSIKSTHISFWTYLKKRTARIYPIAICAFILSILIALINHSKITIADFITLGGNMLMLQDTSNKPGLIVEPFLRNDPLWSLSYEWWFYLMFYPIFFYCIKKFNMRILSTYIVLTISVFGWIAYLVHPNHLFLVAAYFSLWWAGAVCADVYIKFRTFTFINLIHVIIPLMVMTCLTTIPLINTYIHGGQLSQIMYPVISFRHYASSIVVIFVGLVWWKFNLVYFDSLFGLFYKLSSISYAIYITHFTFIWLNIPSVINPYIAIIIKLILTLILSYILELKLQPIFNTWFFGKKNRAKENKNITIPIVE